MLDGLDSQIHVEFRPVEMTRLRQLDRQNLPYGRITKPREISEAHKQLPPLYKQPKTLASDVADLNL